MSAGYMGAFVIAPIVLLEVFRFSISEAAGIAESVRSGRAGTRRVLPLSPAPYHLETIKGTGKVYVSSSSSPKIWVVDQTSAQLVGEIEIKGEAHQMTIVQ